MRASSESMHARVVRWSTNVAIEAAVRRATPRRTANSSSSLNATQQQQQQPPKENKNNSAEEEGVNGRGSVSGSLPPATGNAAAPPAVGELFSAGPPAPNFFSDASGSAGGSGGEGAAADDGSSNGGHDHHPVAGRPPVAVGTKAAAESAGFASKCLRDDKGSPRHGGGDNRPGTKRARAAGSVARHVESVAREFAGLGIPWPPPPPPPSPPKEGPPVAGEGPAGVERCCRRTGVVARVMGSEASPAGRGCAALVVDEQEVAVPGAEPAAAGGRGAGVVARAKGSKSFSGYGAGCAAPAFEERTFGACRPGVGKGREGGGGEQGEGKEAEALSQPELLRPPPPMAEILAGAGLVGSSGGSSSGGAEQGFGVTRPRPQQGCGSRHVYLHEQQHHRQHQQHQTLKQGKGYGYGMVWAPPPPPLPSVRGIIPTPQPQDSSSSEPPSPTSGVLPFGVVPVAERSAVRPHDRRLQAARPSFDGDGGSHNGGRRGDHAGMLPQKRSAGGTRHVIGAAASTAVVTAALAWTSHEQRPTATSVVGRNQAGAGSVGAGSTKGI